MNRDELEAQLRPLISHDCQRLTTCSSCEKRLTRAMKLIDLYTKPRDVELWTAEQVADYIGRDSTHSARAWLSQQGIKRAGDQPHPDSGRPQALYQANEVRAVWFRKALT